MNAPLWHSQSNAQIATASPQSAVLVRQRKIVRTALLRHAVVGLPSIHPTTSDSLPKSEDYLSPNGDFTVPRLERRKRHRQDRVQTREARCLLNSLTSALSVGREACAREATGKSKRRRFQKVASNPKAIPPSLSVITAATS